MIVRTKFGSVTVSIEGLDDKNPLHARHLIAIKAGDPAGYVALIKTLTAEHTPENELLSTGPTK